MAITDFNDPVIINWYTDGEGSKISLNRQNQTYVVLNNKIILSEIPDMFYKINTITVGATTLYESKIGTLVSTNNFSVNYTLGEITVDSSYNGQTVTIPSWYARGIIYFPSSRIYNDTDTSGNVTQTLGDLLAFAKITYLTPVAVFANIATTYPNPLIGHAVQCEDNGKFYRWDGITWQYFQILNSTQLGELLTDVGDRTTLTTINKINLVNAINETVNEISLLSGTSGIVEKANKSVVDTYLVESTGYGIISGLSVSAQATPNMTVNVASGIVYMPDGKRFTPIANTALAVTTADTTKPRTDIAFLSSLGVISYLASALGTAAVAGSRTYPITTNAVAGDTVIINSVAFTAVASGATGNQFNIGVDTTVTATNLTSVLNANTTISTLYIAMSSTNIISLTEKIAGGGNTPTTATVTGIVVITSGTVTNSTAQIFPSAPSVPSGGLLLVEIKVGAAVTTIVATNITDKRKFKNTTDSVESEVNSHKAEDASFQINVKYPPTGLIDAKVDGVTDDTAAVQAIIDYLSANGGGTVYIPQGICLLGVGGVHLTTRNYGLLLKSNVVIRGAGSGLTTFKAKNNTDMDVIISDGITPICDVGLFGFKIDGNQANQADGKMNLWVDNCNYLNVDDLFSFNSGQWGLRFERVTNMVGGSLIADHVADLNADGIHIMDSSYIAIDKIIIDTKGDDGFAIEATNADCHDISIGEIIVTAPVTTAGAGRGIILFTDDAITVVQRSIYNVSIPNAVTRNCKQYGLYLSRSKFYNINISLSDYGSYNAMLLVAGSAIIGEGYIKNSTFDIRSWNSTHMAIDTRITDGTFNYNTLNAKIYNPADNKVGITLVGTDWDCNIMLDYNPLGTKVSPLQGLDMFASKSVIHAQIKGSARNLYLRNGAIDNTFYIGRLEGGTVNDLEIVAGANNNRFIGGEIVGVISNGGTGNKFIGVKGADDYGNVAITPDANGNGTIAHGLKGTPKYVALGIRGDNANHVDAQAVDGTNITVRIKNAAGADVTAGTFTVDWKAQL